MAQNRSGKDFEKEASRNTARLNTGSDPYVRNLLDKIDEGKTVLKLGKDDAIFSQGDTAGAIYFIQDGRVKLSVVSGAGKEAVLAMLGPRSFLGEGCLVGQSVCVSTATTKEPSTAGASR